MQEHVNEKTVALSIRAVKLTARVLQAAIRKVLREIKQAQEHPKLYRGKQTVKQLVGQNAGVSNVEITEGNIKAFKSTARTYGVDFALKRDDTVSPPKWLVFFKGRDADAIQAAFHEFAAKALPKEQAVQKPSLRQQLRHFMEVARNTALKTRHKEQEKSR
ncbi:MAG: PcfB family protein [Ethanoligenens sp.]